MNQRIPNPDCRDGKHGICDGHGWDIDADTAVRCPCTCHDTLKRIQEEAPTLRAYKITYPCCPKDKPCEVHAHTQHKQHAVPASEHKTCECTR